LFTFWSIRKLSIHFLQPNKVFNLDDTPLNLAIRPVPTASLSSKNKCVKLLIKVSNLLSWIFLRCIRSPFNFYRVYIWFGWHLKHWLRWSNNWFTQAGADVNFIDSNGFSYVMLAAQCGLPDTMKCLLEAGANPNIPDVVSLLFSSFTAVMIYFSCNFLLVVLDCRLSWSSSIVFFGNCGGVSNLSNFVPVN
jgi:ankyrin repeat protein